MLVLLTCTLMVSAPIMCVGGIIMALREDLGLSWLIVVSVTVAGRRDRADRVADGAAVPADADPHRRREPGAARADHRHPGRPRVRPRAGRAASGSATANDELTDTALRVGRLMAFMFPTVMLVLNVSSVAVLWFGGHRIEAGEMQIGALTAFLSYLMQILMSIMMATFMLVLVPAGRGLRRAADRGARHRARRWCRRRAAVASSRPARHGRAARRVLQLPGRRRPGAPRASASGPRPGQTTAIIGSTGAGKTTLLSLIPRLFDATGGTVLVDGVDVTPARPRPAARAGSVWCRRRRTCSPGPSRATCATAGRTPPTTSCGRRCAIAQADDFVAAHARGARRADLPGRHQLLRRPAAAPGHRPGGRAPAGDLPVRRLVLGARPGDRRPAAGRAAARSPASRRCSSSPSGCPRIVDADQILVLDDGAVVGLGTHDELVATARRTPRSSRSQLPAEAAA